MLEESFFSSFSNLISAAAFTAVRFADAVTTGIVQELF